MGPPTPLPASEEEVEVYAGTEATTEGHWPEIGPEPVSPEDASAAGASEPPAEVVEDVVRLLHGDLGPDLRQRVDDWLRNGGDPVLEEALSRMADNPMQAAFNLLYGT